MQAGWQRFLSLCRKTSSDLQLDQLLNMLLTIEEKQSIATRVLLLDALLAGDMTQREIAQQLNISIAKITRGSNALKVADDKLKQYLRGET